MTKSRLISVLNMIGQERVARVSETNPRERAEKQMRIAGTFAGSRLRPKEHQTKIAEFFSSQSEVKQLSNFSRKVSLTIFLSEVNSKQKFYFERTCLGQFGFILRCVMGMHLPW